MFLAVDLSTFGGFYHLFYSIIFLVQAKATPSKQKPPAQNGKSPKPNTPAQKQVIFAFLFPEGCTRHIFIGYKYNGSLR